MQNFLSPAAPLQTRPDPATARIDEFAGKLSDYIDGVDFPCVGARAALHTGRARFGLYHDLGSAETVDALRADLKRFSDEFPDPGSKPVTFIAMFDDAITSEAEFERRMWRHLQEIDHEDASQYDWDPSVSSDPSRDDFSFSVGGRAFFVVGLCPVSSRLARRAPMPCLVFNLHDQFEQLRSNGKYASMQKVIRSRDIALQGEINPVLSNFGASSEARQYSGRQVPADWKCPFHHATRQQ